MLSEIEKYEKTFLLMDYSLEIISNTKNTVQNEKLTEEEERLLPIKLP